MTVRHYALPVEETQWRVPSGTDSVFSWEYDGGRERLLSLYEKGKDKQWNATYRLDWSTDVDVADQGLMPDYQVPIYGSPTWERLSRAEKDEVRQHTVSWLFSQFLHGEQGALICGAKVVETVPDLDSKFYAATQVIDEARHVEIYSRYLRTKIEMAYPINPDLRTLLNQTIADSRWDFTYLGMQVMIEGLALAAFGLLRELTSEPLAKALTTYVMGDEARHVAFGTLTLEQAYRDLSSSERRDREAFVVEASYLMRDRLVGREVWERLGFDVEESVRWVEASPIMREFRKQLFSRIVPNIKRIGM